jgi:hypothetical protein
MSHLGQSSTLSALPPFPPPSPGQASPSETSSLWRLAGRQESTTIGLKSLSAGHFEAAHPWDVLTQSAGVRCAMEPKRVAPSVASGPMTNVGSESGASLFGQFTTGQTVNVSREAVRFAQEHRLLGWLVVMKNLMSSNGRAAVAVDVDLVSDPDLRGTPVICFAVHSSASLPDLLDYDERLRGLVCDRIPARDRLHFAIRFDLE